MKNYPELSELFNYLKSNNINYYLDEIDNGLDYTEQLVINSNNQELFNYIKIKYNLKPEICQSDILIDLLTFNY